MTPTLEDEAAAPTNLYYGLGQTINLINWCTSMLMILLIEGQ